jgi:hypothetical protein
MAARAQSQILAELGGASSFATSISTKTHLGRSNDRNPGVFAFELHGGAAVGAAFLGVHALIRT